VSKLSTTSSCLVQHHNVLEMIRFYLYVITCSKAEPAGRGAADWPAANTSPARVAPAFPTDTPTLNARSTTTVPVTHELSIVRIQHGKAQQKSWRHCQEAFSDRRLGPGRCVQTAAHEVHY
jgi:hypothetical protein